MRLSQVKQAEPRPLSPPDPLCSLFFMFAKHVLVNTGLQEEKVVITLPPLYSFCAKNEAQYRP